MHQSIREQIIHETQNRLLLQDFHEALASAELCTTDKLEIVAGELPHLSPFISRCGKQTLVN